MVASGLTFESADRAGFIYVDDAQFTAQQVEWLETEAMRAVLATERA